MSGPGFSSSGPNPAAAGSSRLPAVHDANATWAFLEPGIDLMMTRLKEGMTYPRYMELYTVAYNHFTSSSLASSSSALGRSSGPFGSKGGTNLVGAELYNHLTSYFRTHLEQVRSGSDGLSEEPLLRYYATEWDRYTTAANFVHRLFAYLNRHWVKREKDEGRKYVYTVYILALVQWKEHMFRYVQQKGRLVQALLKQIEKQRNGEVIEASLVKKVVDSLVSLGLDENDTNRQNLDVYRQEFEKPFIEATEVYYTAESDAFVSQNTATDYMKKAETRLKEEEDRVELYLHASTRTKLVPTCDNVLVRRHSTMLWDEFQQLLDLDQADDLFRIYTLLSRIPEGLEPLRQKFEAHVKRVGLAAVEKVLGGGDAAAAAATNGAAGPSSAATAPASAASDSLDPGAYVSALLDAHRSNLNTVNVAFRGEAGFLAALDKACRDFVNRNKATGTSTSKSPELLAKHTDALLKKSNKTSAENSLEEALTDVMVVFKYIEDKDVFQKFYSKMLAKRLVNFASASDDAEANMISRLKEACGFEYTAKLARMFTDMGLSKELNDNFKETMAKNHDKAELDVDFYALVLANGFWPLQAPTTEFSIPTELLPTYERFQRHYSAKHSGRKLTWLWQLSKNEVRANYLSQKQLQFQTSTFQTAVLLQFNTNDSLTKAQLQQATGLNDATIKPVLAMLSKAKVLQPSSSNADEEEAYELNPNFKSKKLRVNLNLPIKSEQKVESNDVLKTVDEDRRLLLQATIVRIMKSRKQLKHQTLIQETVAQVSTRFTPRIPDIKKAIDQLIDKEYLERVEGQKDMYSYLA
ncbi:probable SCF complex member Cullin 1 [Ustilago trichophora]|uniref:Cullin-1 n=1 Tax=Ustilago trichophora TaxID=86804 RepID=A0A5C3DZD7_9BASI|nr:probable SCF complex member Cullin 1 [Ustilago trichophora]